MMQRLLFTISMLFGLSACSTLDSLTPPTLPDYQPAKKVVWLDQNWTNDARYWFHHAPQGTSTVPIPYDWFMALEQPKLFSLSDVPLFSDPDYLQRFGFISSPAGEHFAGAKMTESFGYGAEQPSARTVAYGYQFYQGNPDGLPVGFAMLQGATSPITGEPMPTRLGFTCAACHTGQVDYKGTNIRIDGGAATVELGAFRKALGVAMAYTKLLPWRFDRFAGRVLGENHSQQAYDQLKTEFGMLLDKGKKISALIAEHYSEHQLEDVEEGFNRLDALNRIGNQVFFQNQYQPDNAEFDATVNLAAHSAPVNYPHIWSAPWFDWVQYDGSIMQPMVRNAGEALGVSAHLNLVDKTGARLFDSTVLVKELDLMERLLAGEDPLKTGSFNGLQAPEWPEDVLGKIDRDKAAQGAVLYDQHCQGCHLPPVDSALFWRGDHWQPIAYDDKQDRYLALKVVPLDKIGTDKAQAAVLEKRKVRVFDHINMPQPAIRPGNVICGGESGTQTNEGLFAWALAYVTQKTIENRYDALEPPPGEKERDAMNGNRPNCVQVTNGYKARPLNGIWATAPYLHNGALLSLYDVLTPQAERLQEPICLGNREFDPVKVGLTGVCGTGTTKIDVTRFGNLNVGHSFEDGAGKGVIGPELSEDERYALVEYLKTL